MNVVIAESPTYAPRGLDALRNAGWQVTFYHDDLNALPDRLNGVDGVIARFGLHWDADALRRAAPLRFLAVPATGTDHVDRETADALDITVVSLAGHPGLKEITATPEHAFGLMLALLRHTIPAHAAVLRGAWDRNPYFGRQVRGRMIGLVGLGRTGRAFADMATAFGAQVCYVDPHVTEPAYTQCNTLQELAARSDVVAVHAVLNPSTEGLLDAAFFEAMQPGSYFVNTARGALVDETALLQALQTGRLAGAALDVICHEPEQGVALNSPLIDYARAHDHLILTPHIGGATLESIEHAEWLLARTLVETFATESFG